MTKWIKLKRHESMGTVWYSLPNKNNELKFEENSIINVKFIDGSIGNVTITFHYDTLKTITENDIPIITLLKSPSVTNKSRVYIQLSDVEVMDQARHYF